MGWENGWGGEEREQRRTGRFRTIAEAAGRDPASVRAVTRRGPVNLPSG